MEGVDFWRVVDDAYLFRQDYDFLDELLEAIMVLFDGGNRIEELLNLRIKDLSKEKYRGDTECFWIDVKFSKTFARKIPLPLSTQYMRDWLNKHPEKDNLEAQLFPVKYPTFIKNLKKMAKKALNKRVTPHMLRHSSATYWAPKLNRYQLCAKYGWAFSSDMPDRYIKRKGIIFEEIAEKGDVDQTAKLAKENRNLTEKMEALEQEYAKLRGAMELIIPVISDKMAEPEFQERILQARKSQLTHGPRPSRVLGE